MTGGTHTGLSGGIQWSTASPAPERPESGGSHRAASLGPALSQPQGSPAYPARPPGAPLQGSPEPPHWGHLRREVCHLTGAASAISPGSRQPRPQAATSTSLRRAPLEACASSLGQQCPLPGAQGHLTGATGASLISPAGSILLPREPSAPCAASVASGLRLRPAIRDEPRRP